ncbi:MAG TPA: potassium channel protein [Bryobacteraceae bacterium]|jgi:voltage-gated potassium channel|nr:potassium channel protein [Bryobacteraceae bacterium]
MTRSLKQRVILIVALFPVILCIGTIGFHVIEGYSFFDAFYMTLITVTTVGYQELHALSYAGRVFNSFLILFGVSAVFFGVGVMTQTIIELELQDRYGKRKKRRMIAALKNHCIVCGFGRVGRNAAYELQRAKAPFIVMDRSEQRVERAMAGGMLAIVADATQDECLREAGIARALGLIAALPSDAENLFIILSAKSLNPKLNVVTRASEEEAEKKLRRAGADTVFAPYTMAGQRLAQAVVRPHVTKFLDFATSHVGPSIVMEQICVAERTEFTSKTLTEVQSRRDLGIIVLALRKPDGQMLFNPPPETTIGAGDYLIVLGEQQNLERLEKLFTAAG